MRTTVIVVYVCGEAAGASILQLADDRSDSLDCEALPLMIDSDQPRNFRHLGVDGRLDKAEHLAGVGSPHDPVEPLFPVVS